MYCPSSGAWCTITAASLEVDRTDGSGVGHPAGLVLAQHHEDVLGVGDRAQRRPTPTGRPPISSRLTIGQTSPAVATGTGGSAAPPTVLPNHARGLAGLVDASRCLPIIEVGRGRPCPPGQGTRPYRKPASASQYVLGGVSVRSWATIRPPQQGKDVRSAVPAPRAVRGGLQARRFTSTRQVGRSPVASSANSMKHRIQQIPSRPVSAAHADVASSQVSPIGRPHPVQVLGSGEQEVLGVQSGQLEGALPSRDPRWGRLDPEPFSWTARWCSRGR